MATESIRELLYHSKVTAGSL